MWGISFFVGGEILLESSSKRQGGRTVRPLEHHERLPRRGGGPLVFTVERDRRREVSECGGVAFPRDTHRLFRVGKGLLSVATLRVEPRESSECVHQPVSRPGVKVKLDFVLDNVKA